jgi:hypothetical protein
MTQNQNAPADSWSDELDPNSLAAIRDLLAGEEQLDPGPDAAPGAVKAALAQAAAAPKPKRSLLSPLLPQKQIDQTPHQQAAPVKSAQISITDDTGLMAQLKETVVGYRPTPKHIVLACLALLVYFRPWLVVGVLFLSAFVVTGVFLILGYDGFWHRAMGLARWYAGKHPSRSAEMNQKIDRFAERFDAFLDRFPDGTVDGLYLPDLGELDAAEARHDEALDKRFENLREEKV